MCASSSTSQSLAPFIQEQAPLPLIRCPRRGAVVGDRQEPQETLLQVRESLDWKVRFLEVPPVRSGTTSCKAWHLLSNATNTSPVLGTKLRCHITPSDRRIRPPTPPCTRPPMNPGTVEAWRRRAVTADLARAETSGMKAGDQERTNPASSSPRHFLSSFFLSEIFLSSISLSRFPGIFLRD